MSNEVSDKRRGKVTRRRFFLFSAMTMAASAADAMALEPGWLKVRRKQIGAGEPSHKFVHFTDIHHKGDRQWLEKVVAEINKLSPDFACFTGDLIEQTGFLPEALEIMRGIKAPLYGVPGNHDYWAHADFAQIGKAFAATGGQWLMDESTMISGGRVNIIGATCTKPLSVAPRTGGKNILLMHYPEWVERLPASYDMILAGHSHGGQVRLPFIGSIVVPGGVGKYDLGMFSTSAGPLHVSAGIGYFYLNVRFNCRPEITLFEI